MNNANQTNELNQTGQTDQVTKTNKHTRPRPILFLDVDDVVINTAETLIQILNEQFHSILTTDDIKEWNFSTVLTKLNSHIEAKLVKEPEFKIQLEKQNVKLPITKEFILNIAETGEFWSKVTFKEDFYCLFMNMIHKYHIYFITNGTQKNLIAKENWLSDNLCLETNKNLIQYDFIGLSPNTDKSVEIDKIIKNIYLETSVFPFTIQVDDKYSNLHSRTGDLKILLKNNRETDYNQAEGGREDLYVMNTLKEVSDTIWFYRKYDYKELEELFPLREVIKNTFYKMVKLEKDTGKKHEFR